MLSGFYENSFFRHTLEEASDALSFDLFHLIQHAPEKLHQTTFAQPAILAVSVALFRAAQAEFSMAIDVMAGHSLGEYSALVCAEAIPLIDAAKAVHHRGQCMQAAVSEGQGGMLALVGTNLETVKALCDEARENEILSPANLNTHEQIVIAGNKEAILRAKTLAKERGIKAILLPVSVPSHCALMAPAQKDFRETLMNLPIRLPTIPVIQNVSLKAPDTVEALRENLLKQLTQPVQWVQSIELILKMGIMAFVECGPKKVLTGLNKKICPDVPSWSLSNEWKIETF
jgi:[acyl-carrier-protein] S-malonyltransferase